MTEEELKEFLIVYQDPDSDRYDLIKLVNAIIAKHEAAAKREVFRSLSF